MPERFRRAVFEPDFVTMLVDVFDEVCTRVETKTGAKPSEAVRNTLAKAIIGRAESGETDREKLREHALSALERTSA